MDPRAARVFVADRAGEFGSGLPRRDRPVCVCGVRIPYGTGRRRGAIRKE